MLIQEGIKAAASAAALYLLSTLDSKQEGDKLAQSVLLSLENCLHWEELDLTEDTVPAKKLKLAKNANMKDLKKILLYFGKEGLAIQSSDGIIISPSELWRDLLVCSAYNMLSSALGEEAPVLVSRSTVRKFLLTLLSTGNGYLDSFTNDEYFPALSKLEGCSLVEGKERMSTWTKQGVTKKQKELVQELFSAAASKCSRADLTEQAMSVASSLLQKSTL